MANRPDPEAAGKWLLHQRERHNRHGGENVPTSQIADSIPWDEIPQLKSTSMAQETVQTYITELEAQAVAGVKSSKRALVRLGYWHTCDAPTCDEPIPFQVLTCAKHRPGFGSSEILSIDKNGDAVHPLSSTLTEDDDALN